MRKVPTEMRKLSVITALSLSLAICLGLSGCHEPEGESHVEHHNIELTSPQVRDVVSTREYVCQIHSRRHIEVRALEDGYLEEIPVQEGQTVRKDQVLFKIVPTLYQARLESERAEAQQVQVEFNNTQKLFEKHVVSDQEVAMVQAKLAQAQAKVKLAEAELNFTQIRAPFAGIIDRLLNQQGSLIEQGNILTTLSDNEVMWVYFNVPEADYFEYLEEMPPGGSPPASVHSRKKDDDDDDDDDHVSQGGVHAAVGHLQIQLMLANATLFSEDGKIAAIEADFNNETGNIAFRADFPNPKRKLRHGQTGNILIRRVLPEALVIPQRATFPILDKRFVFVVTEDGVVHQREITIQSEMDDIFVVGSGLSRNDRFVLEGVRQVRDGEHVEAKYHPPEDVLNHLKHDAE